MLRGDLIGNPTPGRHSFVWERANNGSGTPRVCPTNYNPTKPSADYRRLNRRNIGRNSGTYLYVNNERLLLTIRHFRAVSLEGKQSWC